MDLMKNAIRFSGFADLYELARPTPPHFPIEIVKKYLGKNPEYVVDLGCGTGLSSRIWQDHCQELIGIDPSDDMLSIARMRNEQMKLNMRFIKGFSNAMPLDNNSADAIICCQSFHWMEPISTLSEINRILKPGGIFAAMTYDWPPIMNWQCEAAFATLWNTLVQIETTLPDVKTTFQRYPKTEQLSNIRNSGYFRYVREIVFTHEENYTVKRMLQTAESLGSYQIVHKMHPELINNIFEKLKQTLQNTYGDQSFTASYCYRMRIGIK